jgi:hypothetical protein
MHITKNKTPSSTYNWLSKTKKRKKKTGKERFRQKPKKKKKRRKKGNERLITSLMRNKNILTRIDVN